MRRRRKKPTSKRKRPRKSRSRGTVKGLFGDPVSFRKGRLEVLGCARCPQSKETRVKPIIDTALVKGRPVMVWGSHPTKRDNDAGKLFSGAAGNLLWRSLDAVGVTRAQCDAQVVMRCWPPCL